MVETRGKRKLEGTSEPPKPPKKVAKKEKSAPTAAPKKEEKPKPKKGAATVGNTIDLEGFGGEIQTNEGKSVTLKSLVDASKGGVVLFTYPRANTPGCTKQACFFRDKKTDLTSSGFVIYGLSADSPTSNTNFISKYSLNYELLCDPRRTLISAIGLSADGNSKTKRGVFVVNKEGNVLLAKNGSPQETVDWVEELVKA